MKILQINQVHYPRGGADIVYLNNIKLLESYGHEVAHFSSLNPRNEVTEYGNYFVSEKDLRNQGAIKKISNVLPYYFNHEAYRKIKKLIKDFKPDVAHVHLFYGVLSVSVLKALNEEKIPILHTIHDYRFICPVSACLDVNNNVCVECKTNSIFSCIRKKCSDGNMAQSAIVNFEALYWKYFNNPISKIDAFHFVSNFSLNQHLKHFPELKNKSFVLYNYSGLGSGNENPTKNKDIERYFLYYGRISREKGISTLIKAWEKVDSGIPLKIVGTGPNEAEIKDYILNNRLGNVEVLGFKSGQELISLIQNAFFVIVPSEWYENNPMTIIEAYGLGTPVIGSNIGGIPEIIDSGKTGFIFETYNSKALSNTISHAYSLSTQSYLTISNNASRFSDQHFSMDINYNTLIKSYESIIG